jgi:hypothetical protein
MRIAILRGLWWWWWAYCSSKHNNNHNKMMMILTIFTHSLSDNKIKLILSENNTNNLNGNLINQNNTCHSQCDDQIHYYYNMSTWTKKSFSRMAHKDIKLMNHKNHCLLQNESFNGLKISTYAVYNSNCSSFFKWNPLFVQPLEKIGVVFHVVFHLLEKFANSLRDLPFLRSLITWPRGRALILTCINSS